MCASINCQYVGVAGAVRVRSLYCRDQPMSSDSLLHGVVHGDLESIGLCFAAASLFS